jgi:hypothetical protein
MKAAALLAAPGRSAHAFANSWRADFGVIEKVSQFT